MPTHKDMPPKGCRLKGLDEMKRCRMRSFAARTVAFLTLALGAALVQAAELVNVEVGPYEMNVPSRNAERIDATPFFGIHEKRGRLGGSLLLEFDNKVFEQQLKGYEIPPTTQGTPQRDVGALLMFLDDENISRIRNSADIVLADVWHNNNPDYPNQMVQPIGETGLFRILKSGERSSTWFVVSANPETHPDAISDGNVFVGGCSRWGPDRTTGSCQIMEALDIPNLAISLTLAEKNLPLRAEILRYVHSQLRSWMVE